MSDIVGHGFANVRRDRHAVVPLAFASNDEFTGAPVDIVELDSNDLLRPKAQTGKHTSAELGSLRTAARTASTCSGVI